MTRTACLACTAPTDAFLCKPCWARLDTALTALPGLIHDLIDSATRQTRVYRANGRPRTADEDWRGTTYALRPGVMPVDLDAAALLDRTMNVLTTWVRHLCETRGVNP